MADALWWVLAVFVSILPERIWPRLESRLPLRRGAAASGLATLTVGFFAGFAGFMAFAAGTADANNAWMLKRLASGGSDAVAKAPFGFSVVAFFYYLLLTPRGLFCTYLVISGALRAVSAVVDDPRGDPILSFAHWAATSLWAKNRIDRATIARERLEGPDARDVLQTGEWAGIDADFVVLAARRKSEWTKGAIVMTSGDWYRLGEPFDLQTPAGLRTAYPLTRMETLEVVRRGIQYELPRLLRRGASAPAGAASTRRSSS